MIEFSRRSVIAGAGAAAVGALTAAGALIGHSAETLAAHAVAWS